MKKLLRSTANTAASPGQGADERASSRIFKHVLGSFRSSTPTRQQSAVITLGNEAGSNVGSSHKNVQCREAESASEACNAGSPGNGDASAVPPADPLALTASNQAIGADAGAASAATLGRAALYLEDEQQSNQYAELQHPPYESWDRYLSPTGHTLAVMSEPPVEALDSSTEMLFQANVNPYGRTEQGYGDAEAQTDGQGPHPAAEGPDPDTDPVAWAEDSPQQGFTSDAGPIGRTNDSGGHLLSATAEATTQSRRSHGGTPSASQGGIVSAAHAALLATNLTRQPGVNLDIDYGSEIYLTDSTPIGQGQFGSVYRGVYDGKSVAIKLLPKMFLGDASPADVETFIQEAAVLSSVDHPNVVKFYGGSLSPPYVFIVEELMDRSLADVLYKDPQEPFPLSRVLSVGLDVARGLHYLHCCNPAIVHRDLKPENILLDGSGTAKISDFGLARCKYQSYVKTNRREAGSLAYMAPECFDARMGKLTDRLDVFSFGVLLWVMVTRELPWQGMRTHEFLQRMVIGGGRLAVPQDDNKCPLALRRLLSACWSDLPTERPSCEEVMMELERMLKYMPAQG